MYADSAYSINANARFSRFTGQRCAARAPNGADSTLAATIDSSAGT